MTKKSDSVLQETPLVADPLTTDAFSIDQWTQLKKFTQARIAPGRVGSSLPTKEGLEFGLAHGMSRCARNLA